MWSLAVVSYLFVIGNVLSGDTESRVIDTAQGPVRGYKDPTDDVFAYYGIPYATAPTGSQRFKAPLPPPSWQEPFDAIESGVICPQPDFFIVQNKTTKEDCLIANVFVPDTDEKNLPVVVYVHGGGYIIGYGNMATPKKLVNSKRVVAVTFNYRLGPHGFLCLGTEDAPGNAGMKDQVALLRWVRANIERFGGNPHDVTIAGYSAGASAVGLLMVSKMARGLFHKVIPESGDLTAPFSVQVNPIDNAKEYAKLLEVDKVVLDDISELESFYKKCPYELLQSGNVIHRPESNFLMAPCVERDVGEEMFLEENPMSLLKKGDFVNLPILNGFADMEGLMRTDIFDQWKDRMNANFEEFLPADLGFSNKEEKHKVAQSVKEFYFKEKTVSEDTVLDYVNYFTDVIFACPTLRTIKYLLEAGNNQIYLYEYSYVDDSTPVVPHTEVKGADHCAQSLIVSDGLNFTHRDESGISNELKQWKMTVRDIWLNFIIKGKPEGSDIPEWLPVSDDGSPYMVLNQEMKLKESLLKDRCAFWEKIYSKYYQTPVPPAPHLSPIKTEL
ncbi:esterase FE4-like [Vanessa cardui]|uniref:esterase FE4-like n=1 Tax=Vanessa cardui TaxID=171605 RepID=UPI001F1463A0|nr:esterase FE4-like [Vanessa cardui]